MLSDFWIKRHLIIFAPPFFRFLVGAKFFWIKFSIFESGQNKKFWLDFGIDRTLLATNWPIIGQYRPEAHN